MGKRTIQILPDNLANQIAAGEVVERPASVVKELVENAIDANATQIIIKIQEGGKKLIQVVDNGKGMTEEDLVLAFERHATSKIKTANDLHHIETLGFRGEALPSIASVSMVEAKSRHKSEPMGNVYRITGGKDGKLVKTAANIGTSISVKNLFFNTPARRRFLKSDTAEYQQILNVLKKFFLAYPNIHFELWVEDKQAYKLPESAIDERVREVLGNSLFQGMLKLSNSLGGIDLRGFISRPDVVRKSRAHQFLFLNGRPIKDKSLNHAIYQGYANLISPGEFPVYCLFLEMDPGLTDVNVHPTKMEVRFSNERSLYYFFINSVKQVLNQAGVIPQFSGAGTGSAVGNALSQQERTDSIMQELQHKNRYMARYAGAQLSLTYFSPEEKTEPADQIDSTPAEQSQAPVHKVQPLPVHYQDKVDVQFWQIHNRYILSEIKSGMVIIDQHVAHERILYERILKVLKEGSPSYGQKLLFPHKLTLAYDDFMVLQEIYEKLNKIGFSIKIFSGNTIVIEAMPADVKVGRESQILLEIIDYYRNEPLKDFDPLEKVAAAFACKNAIKSGEKLSQAEMQNLVDQLFACESPFFCPHGRPVIITIDLEELDRKFKRI